MLLCIVEDREPLVTWVQPSMVLLAVYSSRDQDYRLQCDGVTARSVEVEGVPTLHLKGLWSLHGEVGMSCTILDITHKPSLWFLGSALEYVYTEPLSDQFIVEIPNYDPTFILDMTPTIWEHLGDDEWHL